MRVQTQVATPFNTNNAIICLQGNVFMAKQIFLTYTFFYYFVMSKIEISVRVSYRTSGPFRGPVLNQDFLKKFYQKKILPKIAFLEPVTGGD